MKHSPKIRHGRALNLIASNPRNLTREGHGILNGSVAALLEAGLIRHEPRRAVGYDLTNRGKATLADEGEPEVLWEAFEAGTSDAISDDLANYTDEDYGIESEDV